MRKLISAWGEFAGALGAFQSRILLGLFYLIISAPFGFAVRAFADPLQLHSKLRGSNWTKRDDSADESMDSALRQY